MKNGRLRVLHTSDWHIGHLLFDKKRDEEFRFFFEWLCQIIRDEAVDCLLVAGDIFDTASPSSRAQQMYYHYLQRFRENGCRHIVITAGNHDPAVLLQAPRAPLRIMDIHLYGEPDIDSPENEALVLYDKNGKAELIICAVPFLREKYVRRSAPGESAETKEQKIIEGIYAHYANVLKKVRELHSNCKEEVPLIAMGHLFAGKNSNIKNGDTERTLYVGSLGQIGCELFDEDFDYVALGHLHLAQIVDNKEYIRYSGSPLPMGFSEADQQKSVTLIEFEGRKPIIKILPVPSFRHLERICGDWQTIEDAIEKIVVQPNEASPWLEIIYNGEEYPGNMRERLDELGVQKGVEILGIRDLRLRNSLLEQSEAQEELEELAPFTVFERCLRSKNVPETHWPELCRAFNEVCLILDEEKEEPKS